MSDSALAAIFALGTAVSSGAFSILVRKGQRYGGATTGVLIGLIVGIPPLAIATVVFWDPAWWVPGVYLYFAAAGVLGPCFGRVFMYLAIHHLGVSRAVPLKTVAPLFTAMLAYWLLGERPGPYVWMGTLLIVAGCVAFTIKKKDDSTWSRRLIWLPFAAVVAFGFGAIVRKIGLGILPAVLPGITITSLTGLLFLWGFSAFLPRDQRPDLRWGKAWYFYGACGLINTLSFLASFYSLLYGDVTIVMPLSNTAPFFALLLSHFLLRDQERVTRLVVMGTVLTVAGGGLIAWRVF